MVHSTDTGHAHYDCVLPSLRRNVERPVVARMATLPHEPSWVAEYCDETGFRPLAMMKALLGEKKFQNLGSAARLMPSEGGVVNNS